MYQNVDIRIRSHGQQCIKMLKNLIYRSPFCCWLYKWREIRHSLFFDMGYTTLWRRLSSHQLNITIQIFSLISIFFEGYDQGVMGGVNASPTYITEVGIGTSGGTVIDMTHQGGLVSIYYLGCIFGCFVGGWLADRLGRINGLFIGSIFALVGGALQAAIQSSDFMLVARVITGIGTGGK